MQAFLRKEILDSRRAREVQFCKVQVELVLIERRGQRGRDGRARVEPVLVRVNQAPFLAFRPAELCL